MNKCFNNHSELIQYITSFNTQRGRLDAIVNYFLNYVEYDYVMIEHTNKPVSTQFLQYVDKLFPNTNEVLRNKAMSYLRNCCNISNEYWQRIKDIYFAPLATLEYPTLEQAFDNLSAKVIFENGLLKKGLSADIVRYAKCLCWDAGIKCLIVEGITCEKNKHWWLNICVDGVELFYDIAYAMFVRDNFCGMGRYDVDDWLGITPKTLHKQQPSRRITQPGGFDLEQLGLQNATLNMMKCLDAI